MALPAHFALNTQSTLCPRLIIIIFWLQVNDDYCDCQDGSDEPGTAACTGMQRFLCQLVLLMTPFVFYHAPIQKKPMGNKKDGTFHCPNVGFVPKNIRSSRVNDGICDCCDASDEYGVVGGDGNKRESRCENTCLALGEESREARRQLLLLLRQGSEIRQQYLDQAKDRLQQEAARLADLKLQVQEADGIRLEKDAVKRAAEQKEKQALDRFKEQDEARKQQQQEQEFRKDEARDQLAAQQAFHDLDTDQDAVLTFDELKSRPAAFDQDGDGVVSDDEAKFFLHMKDQMDVKEWTEVGWAIAKPHYLKSKQPAPPSHPGDIVTAAPDAARDEDQELDDLESFGDQLDSSNNVLPHEDGREEEDEEGDEEDDPAHQYSTPDHVSDPLPGPPDHKVTTDTTDYDEETKALMEEARRAKEEWQEAENKWQDLDRQVQQLEKTAGTDFGPDHAFLPLYGQCFDLTDREYVYTLCPFDKAVQRPKDGGTETMLGRWGRWSNSDGHSDQHARYTGMRYEGGTSCWNGPARSVDVSLSCGLENRVTQASEPNRCEYRMHLTTPALCTPTHSLMADTSDEEEQLQHPAASHQEL